MKTTVMQQSKVTALTTRTPDREQSWLVTLIMHTSTRADVDARGRFPTPCPQAAAVVDDFGDLVLVTAWL